jgi:ABC-type Mn2+/Zn2+ transport system permease subunit
MIALLAVITAIISMVTVYQYPKWALVVLSASVIYGALSTLISARRLYFLSAASAHIALLAVVLAIPLSRLILNEYVWAVIIGLLLLYAVGYSIHKGMDEDVATAIFVSLTASLSVIAMYIVLTKFSVTYDLWVVILGDPLLASWTDVYYAVTVAVVTLTATILTYREQVCIGIERDCAVLSGINVSLYDWLLYTLLGIATVAMIKIVGFVLQHVLILLPSAIAMLLAKDSKSMLFISVLVSILSGLLGLQISILINQVPSGVIGLLMFGIFALAFVAKRCCHG